MMVVRRTKCPLLLSASGWSSSALRAPWGWETSELLSQSVANDQEPDRGRGGRSGRVAEKGRAEGGTSWRDLMGQGARAFEAGTANNDPSCREGPTGRGYMCRCQRSAWQGGSEGCGTGADVYAAWQAKDEAGGL